jgi:hypothetical protein
MLHKKPAIIAPKIFSLIQELQAMNELKQFYLVGGTALALQLGHRNSIDIDLFCQQSFDDTEMMDLLNRHFQNVSEVFRRPNTIICLINNIKTDFIKHDYKQLMPAVTEEGITMLSKEDIAGMKLHAIIQSCKRLKDFIDIYFLLEHFSMEQMIHFFAEKYTYSNPMIALKAVNFFDDIDEAIDPPKLLKPLKTDQIKKRIQEAVLKPSKIFK